MFKKELEHTLSSDEYLLDMFGILKYLDTVLLQHE